MADNVSVFKAEDYDEKIKQTLPYYDEFYVQITDIVYSMYGYSNINWLDVGCGTGKMAETAFSRLSIENFTFCDYSQEFIDISKQRFSKSRANFIVADIRKINFSNKFDVVTAVQVNHYFNKIDRATVIRNCYNALKSNGMFITFENFAPESKITEQLYLRRWKTYQQVRGKTEKESDNHIRRYGNDYFPITLRQHIELIKNCGFKAVEIIWLSYMQVGILAIK